MKFINAQQEYVCVLKIKFHSVSSDIFLISVHYYIVRSRRNFSPPKIFSGISEIKLICGLCKRRKQILNQNYVKVRNIYSNDHMFHFSN